MPTELPTGMPSSCPSRNPSGQPSEQPSGEPSALPTSNPSSILSTQLTITYISCVGGIESDRFRALIRSPFEDSVAGSIETPLTGLTTDNVMVIEVAESDLCEESTENRLSKFYAGGSTGNFDKVMETHVPRLEVSFTVKFPVELSGFTDPVSARDSISTQLEIAVASGTLSASVEEGIAKSYPELSAVNMTVSNLQASSTDNDALVFLSSAPPTLMPTMSSAKNDQGYVLAYCSIALMLMSLLVVVVSSRSDLNKEGDKNSAKVAVLSSDKSDRNHSSASVNIVDGAIQNLIEPLGYGYLPSKNMFSHHRWLSGFISLESKPRYIRSTRLILFCIFELLFIFILLRYGKLDIDDSSQDYVWWFFKVSCINAAFGCVLFGLGEYWLYRYCNSESVVPSPSTRIRPQPSRSADHGASKDKGGISKVLLGGTIIVNDLSRLQGEVSALLQQYSSNSNFEYAKICEVYGLSGLSRMCRDYKYLRAPGDDLCSPLLLLRELVFVRTKLKDLLGHHIENCITSDSSNQAHGGMLEDVVYRDGLRKLSVQLFFLDVLPRLSSELFCNQIQREHWLKSSYKSGGQWFNLCATYVILLSLLVYLMVMSKFTEVALQARIVILFFTWLCFDLFVISNLSLWVRHTFFCHLMKEDVHVVHKWILNHLFNEDKNVSGNDWDSCNIHGQCGVKDFNAGKYFFMSQRLISGFHFDYPESKAIMSFCTIWPSRSFIQVDKTLAKYPAQWMNCFGDFGVCLNGSVWGIVLFQLFKLLFSLPIWLQDVMIDGFLWGILLFIGYIHVQLFVWNPYFLLVPGCLVFLLWCLHLSSRKKRRHMSTLDSSSIPGDEVNQGNDEANGTSGSDVNESNDFDIDYARQLMVNVGFGSMTPVKPTVNSSLDDMINKDNVPFRRKLMEENFSVAEMLKQEAMEDVYLRISEHARARGMHNNNDDDSEVAKRQIS